MWKFKINVKSKSRNKNFERTLKVKNADFSKSVQILIKMFGNIEWDFLEAIQIIQSQY
ncbi:hypothetical protein [Clostridium tagluense]|uniref:Uncharacterized protein n=1 Tax=Clostridium tagluense TaxID=360422 RepID=A0A401USS9_9CLOT|nr:hypothetical protein [Clostridium tagluense]GCD12603.1 hypothetical protein Ctaglu_42260 [Clostridium tagluense]